MFHVQTDSILFLNFFFFPSLLATVSYSPSASMNFNLNIRGVPNSDFCRIRIFCRIHFAESEYSAEHSALPNNEENMFNQASVQCSCSIKQVTLYQ